MSFPSKTTEPDVTGRTPETVLSVVVLPAPFAPMSVTISPSRDLEADALDRLDAAVVDVQITYLKQHRSALPNTPG